MKIRICFYDDYGNNYCKTFTKRLACDVIWGIVMWLRINYPNSTYTDGSNIMFDFGSDLTLFVFKEEVE